MTRIAGLVAFALLLPGCAASMRESYAPDGRRAYALNCSGKARGWDKCFAAAGDICQAAGFDVLDRSSEESAVGGVGGGWDRSGGAVAGLGGKTSERSMVIACRK